MSALTALAEPFQYQGIDIRMAVDDNGHIFIAVEDIFTATGTAGMFSVESLQSEFPFVWFKQLPNTDIVLVNEVVLYQLLRSLDKYHFTMWFYDEVLPALRANKLFITNAHNRYVDLRVSIQALKAAAKGIAAAMDEETISSTEVYSQLLVIIEKQEAIL